MTEPLYTNPVVDPEVFDPTTAELDVLATRPIDDAIEAYLAVETDEAAAMVMPWRGEQLGELIVDKTVELIRKSNTTFDDLKAAGRGIHRVHMRQVNLPPTSVKTREAYGQVACLHGVYVSAVKRNAPGNEAVVASSFRAWGFADMYSDAATLIRSAQTEGRLIEQRKVQDLLTQNLPKYSEVEVFNMLGQAELSELVKREKGLTNIPGLLLTPRGQRVFNMLQAVKRTEAAKSLAEVSR